MITGLVATSITQLIGNLIRYLILLIFSYFLRRLPFYAVPSTKSLDAIVSGDGLSMQC